MTISQHPVHARVGFTRWAIDEGLQNEAQALLTILGDQSARTDLLRIALRRLAATSPLLSSWAEDGIELYGLAGLAARLRQAPDLLSRLPGRAEPPMSDILSSFHGQASSHYLYISWTAREPVRPTSAPWVSALRAWLLVHAMRCVQGEPASLQDGFVAEACLRLRMASEETALTPWLDEVDRWQLSDPSRWFRLQQHLQSIPEPSTPTSIDRKPVLRALRELANGNRKPIAGDFAGLNPTVSVTQIRKASGLRRLPAMATPIDGPEDARPEPQPVPLIDDLEQDEELGIVQIPVDVDHSPAEQELHGRYIQLLSGADARFLAWDWYCLTPPEGAALQRLLAATGSHSSCRSTRP